MPSCWPERALPAGAPGCSESAVVPTIGNASLEDEQFLLYAFRSFAEAAGSLEQSYGKLRTEVERLRRELEDTQSKLRREEALAEIASVLAHEIRNPLGSLELFAGLLAESDLDSDCRTWVGHVQAGLRTLAATVNNVLHFHSLPEPQRAPVDLGELLGWARDFFRPLARQSRVALSLQNRVAGVLFPADRHRLEQVLLNLVLNAIRAMPGGGWIELGGRKVQQGRAVMLVVSDTGPGISAEHLPSIFEPGFSTRAGSPGLGLAVCRKIVEQHGGTITAGSCPGRGATFTLIFPLPFPLNPQPAEGVTE
jgi:two-component system sensor histidine kinase FlrB